MVDKIPKIIQRAKDKIFGIFDKVVPAYGHAQAISFPDLPYLCWSYNYDSSDEFSDQAESFSENDNTKRFIDAFKEIDKLLTKFIADHKQYKDNSLPAIDRKTLFETLIVKKSDKGRVKQWKETMKNLHLFDETDPMMEYDEHEWLKDAFSNFSKKKFKKRSVEGAILADGFKQSKWYGYYQAVHRFKKAFFDTCTNNFNLVIPR